MKKVIAHLRLMRPANIVTAVADIMAGFAASGATIQVVQFDDGFIITPHLESLLWLMLSTIGLYGGGVVFNDVFDADLDKLERPERPIPSGQASVMSASLLGAILLALGVGAAWQVSWISGFIALLVAVLAFLYDAWGKHQHIFGPINMGLCRGGNLLLGVSAIPEALTSVWFIALIPIVYIAAITMISRGEVHGSNHRALQGGIYLYSMVIAAILTLSFWTEEPWWQAIFFLILFAYMIYPPLLKALKEQKPRLIGKAVKAGVISLIVMDACLATAFSGWQYGILVLILLPLSFWVAKRFAVT